MLQTLPRNESQGFACRLWFQARFWIGHACPGEHAEPEKDAFREGKVTLAGLNIG